MLTLSITPLSAQIHLVFFSSLTEPLLFLATFSSIYSSIQLFPALKSSITLIILNFVYRKCTSPLLSTHKT